MRIHPGRAAVVAISLAEAGSVLGALLAWLYLVGRQRVWHGPIGVNGLLGACLWAMMVGLPIGGLIAPLLGLTILRRTPIKHMLVLPAAGALGGLVVGAAFDQGRALPVPTLTVVLLSVGILVGSVIARMRNADERPRLST